MRMWKKKETMKYKIKVNWIECPNCGKEIDEKTLMEDEFGNVYCPSCLPNEPDEEDLENIF